MSRTDNTRPWDVQMADRPVVTGRGMPIMGGSNSDNGAAVMVRQQGASSQRANERQVLCQAHLVIDTDTIDIPPIRADRKTTGWRHD